MKSASKIVLMIIMTIVVMVMTSSNLSVEARVMKTSTKEQVVQPQNFYGGAGGAFFPGSGSPGIVTGFGFSPNTVCTIPGGCVPISSVFPSIPGGGLGSGGPVVGAGSVPIVPHN